MSDGGGLVINATRVSVGVSHVTESVHFTGGLRGIPTNRGWALFPVPGTDELSALVFQSPRAHYEFAFRECQQQYIGTCLEYKESGNSPPMDVWESGAHDKANNLSAADSWNAVAYQASEAGDDEYADCATYISVCLRVAGLRLRDVSNKYHDQLKWALAGGRNIGTWFSNVALLDLYADFHSLASELSSARDHLARIAAIHAGAPDSVDSLARLEGWIKKSGNRHCSSEPIVASLQSASGEKGRPNWLRRLGSIRNEMLHRVPMGADKSVSALTLEVGNTSCGEVVTIRLGEPQVPLDNQSPDPLFEFSQLASSLEQLCRTACKSAKYPAVLPEVKGIKRTPTN